MTFTLELTPEQEARLREKAQNAGLEPEAFLRRLIEMPEVPQKSLADTLKSYVGVIDGTPGPGDGRAWSEIEAACDPL